MGWWDTVTGKPFQPAEETETRSQVSIGDPEIAFLLGYSTPGTPAVSEYSSLTLSAVFRAVSLVAGSIAGLPMRTMMENGPGRTEVSSSFLDNPGAATAANGVRLTNFEWKELVVIHLLLHGNAYLQHIYNGAGALIALNPIHPLQVSVEWDASRYGDKLFKVSQPGGGPVIEMDSRDMTHIMGMSFDGLCGVSTIGLARQSLGTAMSGDKAANRQFKNGAMISGLITPKDGEDLTEDEARVIKNHVNTVITGAENAGDIPVINRALEFTPWTLSAEDAQFIESRTFQIDEVGRWFGVPPHLLGLTEKSTSWGQGIAEQNRGLGRYTLSSWTNRIQERLSTLLPSGKWVEFDYSAFVKPSPEDEVKLLIDQVNSGLLTLNEAREVRNLPRINDPNADLPRIPAGSIPPTQAAAPTTEVTP